MIRYFFLYTFVLFNSLFSSTEQLNFSFNDMKIISSDEYLKENYFDISILNAIKNYHETASFNQSVEQYTIHPNNYFKDRLVAIDQLLEAIENKQFTDQTHTKIKTQAFNKRKYIEALPDLNSGIGNKPLLSHCTKHASIIENFWFEVNDPLHRHGKEVSVYQKRWQVSEVPNFFIFLDTVEDNNLLNKYCPQNQQVKYNSSENDRNKQLLTFNNGFAYLNDQLYDTSCCSTSRNGRNVGIYVTGLDGNFYVDDQVKHSSIFAAEDIIGAGEILATNGKIVMISNRSGHYKPNEESLRQSTIALKNLQGSLEDTCVQLIYKFPEGIFENLLSAEDFLQNGISSHPLLIESNSPLHTAIITDNRNWAYLATDHRLVNKVYQKATPLQLAASKGNAFWIKLLLANGADSSLIEKHNKTPLELAAETGHPETIRLLLEVTENNEIRKRAALYAAKSGNFQAVKIFETNNIPLEFQDENGSNILHYAASAPTTEVLEYLLSTPYAIYFDSNNYKKENPLHIAAAYGAPENIQILHQLGLKLSLKNEEGNNPIHMAAKHGNNKAIAYFLKTPSLDAFYTTNNDGLLPLHYAATNIDHDLFKMLIEIAGTTELTDNTGETLLFYTLNDNKVALVNLCLLLEMGADPLARNDHGFAAIHKAASQKKKPVHIMELLTYSDDIDLETNEGDIPLHLAIQNESIANISYLVNYATLDQLNKKNLRGLNALDLSLITANEEIIELVFNKYHDLLEFYN